MKTSLLLAILALTVVSSQAFLPHETHKPKVDKALEFGENLMVEASKIIDGWKESAELKKKETFDTVKALIEAKLGLLYGIKNAKINLAKTLAAYKIGTIAALAKAKTNKINAIKSAVSEEIEKINAIWDSLGELFQPNSDASNKENLPSGILSHPLIVSKGNFLDSHLAKKLKKFDKYGLLPPAAHQKPNSEVEQQPISPITKPTTLEPTTTSSTPEPETTITTTTTTNQFSIPPETTLKPESALPQKLTLPPSGIPTSPPSNEFPTTANGTPNL